MGTASLVAGTRWLPLAVIYPECRIAIRLAHARWCYHCCCRSLLTTEWQRCEQAQTFIYIKECLRQTGRLEWDKWFSDNSSSTNHQSLKKPTTQRVGAWTIRALIFTTFPYTIVSFSAMKCRISSNFSSKEKETPNPSTYSGTVSAAICPFNENGNHVIWTSLASILMRSQYGWESPEELESSIILWMIAVVLGLDMVRWMKRCCWNHLVPSPDILWTQKYIKKDLTFAKLVSYSKDVAHDSLSWVVAWI